MILDTLFVVIICDVLMEGIVLVPVLRDFIKKACCTLVLVYFNNHSFGSVFDR